ncbi:DUF1800 domain-containing protein [Roseateles puraquae]|uniref:DUF1800 domain-containing protein n=1 Tax=Roseateles puraquae TaxID=431059 RepID=A0A254NAT7_9BURK|nr:DUF1800 domain-containing protein [Roseateles puraquae]OWR02548.1 hypothetical protein CDO81_19030 [Roseateles puraquae]
MTEPLTLAPCPAPTDAADPAPSHPALPASLSTTAALVASAATLAACGGGGSSDAGGGSAPPPPVPAPPPPPPVKPTDAEAARFLAQATFGARADDIAAIKANGYAAWLDAQFALPVTAGHFDWLVAQGYAVDANKNTFNGVDNTLWRKLLSAPDLLRQRVVLALSEIFVISMAGIPVTWRGFAVAAYVDMLEQRAFGTYRDLLEGVSLSCGMGVYLNMRGNQKEDPKTGRVPDENYAREVMQLFSIGLVQLNDDGSPKRDANGKALETYTQSNITDLARVFTGWDFDGASATDPAFMRKPMVNNPARFSTGAKKVLTVDIPSTADGPTAMKTALDTLANHPNVGPFIGRQLIQRLVCSNPSPAYIARISAVWSNNGAGVRGDLKAVIRAILLDTEARSIPTAPGAGKLREPLQRFIQWGRTFGVTSPTGVWNIGDASNPSTRLGQSPLRSPSVFNFFRPGYVPPGSDLGLNAVTAPEFQLCNETTVAGFLNFMQTALQNGVGEVKANYTAEIALAADATALVNDIGLRLAGGTLSSATTTAIATAVASIAATTDAGKLNRVLASILLVMASPEYQIQK